MLIWRFSGVKKFEKHWLRGTLKTPRNEDRLDHRAKLKAGRQADRQTDVSHAEPKTSPDPPEVRQSRQQRTLGGGVCEAASAC